MTYIVVGVAFPWTKTSFVSYEKLSSSHTAAVILVTPPSTRKTSLPTHPRSRSSQLKPTTE